MKTNCPASPCRLPVTQKTTLRIASEGRPCPPYRLAKTGVAAAIIAGILCGSAAQGAVVTWAKDAASLTWSTGANWAGGSGEVVAGDTADFTKQNIAAARTVTIDTTPRTVGTFLIGDSASSYFGYTIAGSGGATLTFDNNGSGATLTQAATSGANIFSVPIVLNDTLAITNNHASSTLTLSGGITSTGSARNITLNAASGGAIALTTGIVNNAGTITNSGAGAGVVTISAALGSSVTGVTQNSASSTLTLSGANTNFAGAVTLTSGTLKIGSATALGGNGSTTGTGGSLTIGAGTTLDASTGVTLTTVNAQYWNGDFTFAGSYNLNMGSGAVTLGGNRTLTTTSGTLTIGGVIGDGGHGYSLSKTGSGRLILTGSNTFTGGITVGAGSLVLSGSNATSGVTLNGGTLILNNANAAGTGSLTINGGSLGMATSANTILTAATIALNGNFSYGGGSSLYSLNLGSGAVTLGNNITIDISVNDGTQWLVFGGAIGDGGNGYGITLASSGVGGLNMNAANTFSGGFTLNSGKLSIGNGAALGTGTFTINGGSITANGKTLTQNNIMVWNGNFSIAASTGALNLGTGAVTLGKTVGIDVAVSQTLTVGGVIGDAGGGYGLTKTGLGGVTLTGSNTYGGNTTVNGGTLSIAGGNDRLPTATNLIVNGGASSGGTFDLNGRNQTVSGLNGASGTVNGLVTNRLAATTSTLTVNATGADSTYGGVLADGGSGKILALTKAGGRKLTLSGTNTYTGATLVSGGELAVNGSLTASGTVRISSGGTLSGSGSVGSVVLVGGTLNGTLSTGAISGNGLVSPGNSPGILTATSVTSSAASGLLSFAFELGASALDYTNATASLNDVLHITTDNGLILDAGTNISVYFSSLSAGAKFDGGFFVDGMSAAALEAAIASATFTFYVQAAGGSTTFNGNTYNAVNATQISVSAVDVTSASFATGTVDGAQLEFAVVPEPATWAMILGGVGMLLGAQRLRRRGGQ